MAADRSAECTALIVSMFNAKQVIVSTPSDTITADTVDMATPALGQFTVLKQVVVNDADGNVLVDGATWSGTVLTFGTLTTGAHHILVTGTT